MVGYKFRFDECLGPQFVNGRLVAETLIWDTFFVLFCFGSDVLIKDKSRVSFSFRDSFFFLFFCHFSLDGYLL